MLRTRQRQAYNLGVELGLGSERVPSAWSGYETLTARRRAGDMPAHSLRLQRAGQVRGLAAVDQFRRSRFGLEQSVAYWTDKANTTTTDDAGGRRAARKLARAEQKLESHVNRGERRLFRRRKGSELVNGPALVFDETVRVSSDCVVLPGGVRLRTVCAPELPDDGRVWQWTGAARVVDVTAKITARARPEHRRYVVHLSAKADTPEPAIPESPDEIVGVDCGVAIPVATSTGEAHHLPEYKALQAEIRALQRAKARCDYGSRQWKARTRRIRALNKRLHNLRVDGSRQIAAQVAKSGHAEVAVEDLKLKNMVASAKGTTTHPGRNVAAKRGLNRSLHRVAIGRLHQHIERACHKQGLSFSAHPPQFSSRKCHRCGGIGQRETQADFRCPHCGWVGNADHNAANNIRILAWERRQGLAVESRNGPEGNQTSTHSATKTGTNKYPTPTGTQIYKPPTVRS